jgi:hypothetical protein
MKRDKDNFLRKIVSTKVRVEVRSHVFGEQLVYHHVRTKVHSLACGHEVERDMSAHELVRTRCYQCEMGTEEMAE